MRPEAQRIREPRTLILLHHHAPFADGLRRWPGAHSYRRLVPTLAPLTSFLRTTRGLAGRLLASHAPRVAHGAAPAAIEIIDFRSPEVLARALANSRDRDVTEALITTPHVLVPHRAHVAQITVLVLLKKPPQLDRASMRRHWRGAHAELVVRRQRDLGYLGYRQFHASNDELSPLAQGRYEGVAALSFADVASLVRAFASVRGQRANLELVADELRFIDVAASQFLITHEQWCAEHHEESLVC